MERNVFLSCVCAAALLAIAGCGEQKSETVTQNESVTRRPGQPDVFEKFDEDAMTRAIAEARASWRQFADALAKPGEDMTHFSIKRGFKVDDDPEGEHIWLSDVSFDGQKFKGKVDNEPVETKAVKLGDVVDVTPENLSDWMYVKKGILQGGYTIRVLAKDQTPEEREQFFKQAGFRIE